jgi:hypothetical protein
MYPEKLIFTRAEMAKIIGMGYSTTSRLLEQNRADELPKSKKSGGPKKFDIFTPCRLYLIGWIIVIDFEVLS